MNQIQTNIERNQVAGCFLYPPDDYVPGCRAESGLFDVILPPHIWWTKIPRPVPDHGHGQGQRSLSAIRRKQEFLAGRRAAYAALQQAGFIDNIKRESEEELLSLVGRNPDRSPEWPAGFVGSISHSRRWVLAAAARSCDYQSIGIDSEVIVSREHAESLKADIGQASEWKLFEDIGMELPVAFTLLFSAKEAFYKCWYPITGTFLDFRDVVACEVKCDQNSNFHPDWNGLIVLQRKQPESLPLTVRFQAATFDVFTISFIGQPES